MALPRGGFGSPSVSDSGNGLHLGRVTRITDAGAFVEVSSLAKGFEYGPCRYPADGTLEAGDTVLCGFLSGGRDELVVVVRLT